VTTSRAVGVVFVMLVVAALVRLLIAPAETCPTITTEQARASAAEAVSWYRNNLQPDGSIRYRVDLATGDDQGGYLTVRHSGAMLALYQAARAGVPDALATGDAARVWALANLVPAADGVTLAPPSTPYETGPAALLAAALLERRAATGDPVDDATLNQLGAFLVANVAEDGKVAGRWDPVDGPQYDEPSPYYTGETFFALAKLHTAFPDAGYDEAARRIADYITVRDGLEGYWPGVPEHWASYAFAEMLTAWPEGEYTLTDEQVTYLRRQAGMASFEARWESQRTGEFPTTLTRGQFVTGAGLGTVGELLANLFKIAVVEPRLSNIGSGVAERGRCVSGIISDRQLTATEAQQESAQPSLVQGAWFREGVTQMDDQQHTLSALLLSYPNLEGVPFLNPQLTSWLALLALLALWNPGYVAMGVPQGPRSKRVLFTAVGCLLGGAVLVGISAVGEWILDALDISAPTAWIAAGVMVLAGAWMGIRGPRSVTGDVSVAPPPALGARGYAPPGSAPLSTSPSGVPWPTLTAAPTSALPQSPEIEGKVAVVPIAWPLVLRATLIVTAIAFGPNPGPVLVGGVAAVATALTVALVELWPPTLAEPWWNRWTRNLFSALAVLAGIAVLVDGIFGV
jgi:small neutral amino acid transporter SnatA (MarC family)